MKNSPNDKSFFMGRVTASVAHELQNVLAIIRETAGLMQDFMMMGDACQDFENRLSTGLASIKNQVSRGVGLTQGLNRFAHTADHLHCPIDIRDILDRLVLLTERMARNKGFSLSLAPGASHTINHDPVAFQTLCFLCLEALEQTLPSGQALVITPESPGKGARIGFACPGLPMDSAPLIRTWPNWNDLAEACCQYGVELSLTDTCPGICLGFP
ncbi:MAG: hypothetical protein KKD44_20920 [Proteobacteria bacterium]|nr:hypothetical protein [Pseudomonadota bacterium]